MDTSIKKKSNRLITEKSPYLLQHAYNPVNWYPWGDEAFKKAEAENKPIFLSIGYSTCHWCHVMEKESFEDEEVASLMNELFVSIKVDREERPDIDNIYMMVCQLMTGSGGWPLTVCLMPDKKPFFAGTYFPKHSRYGRIGMMDLLKRISELWSTKKEDVIETSANITELLNQVSNNVKTGEIDKAEIQKAFEQLSSRFDEEYGGFGSAPKFPSPHNLLFLLNCWKNIKNDKALYMVEKTLIPMRLGGIYDHIGFGFHRYSTDRHWFVPHFEKMLYDQAMLTIAYTETYQATKNQEYKVIANEILTYVLRDMRDSLGGFYSAEDADSEGVEGKFYVWSYTELKEVLSQEELNLAIKLFNVSEEGNYLEEATREKTGENILFLNKASSILASDMGLSVVDLKGKIELIREKLFNIRKKRIHPYKDDKILVSWNGLMIVALSKAARAFNNEEYSKCAQVAVDFIFSHMYKDGKLSHRYRDNDVSIEGHLDDYVFLIWGLIELYQTTFESKYLEKAMELNNYLLKHFWDSNNGGFFFTHDEFKDNIVRQKEFYDGAIPSGNSICMLNLFKLYQLTLDINLKQYLEKLEQAFYSYIKQSPVSHTCFLTGLDCVFNSASEIIVIGDPKKEDTKLMLQSINEQYLPNSVIALKNPNDGESLKFVKYIDSMKSIDGKATAYICQNGKCNQPITDIVHLYQLLTC